MSSLQELMARLSNDLNSSQTNANNPGGPGNPGTAYNTAYNNRRGEIEGAMLGPTYPSWSGQQPTVGRYRPPTLGANGSDPTNWNDYGGYSYNVPNAFGTGGPSGPNAVYAQQPAPPVGGPRFTGAAGPAAPIGPRFNGRPDQVPSTAVAPRGPAYMGPPETHVGGASASNSPWTPEEKEDMLNRIAAARGMDKPAPVPVAGGTKGPAQAEVPMEPLEDWVRPHWNRNTRWGRY